MYTEAVPAALAYSICIHMRVSLLSIHMLYTLYAVPPALAEAVPPALAYSICIHMRLSLLPIHMLYTLYAVPAAARLATVLALS